MAYKVRYERPAQKALAKLPRRDSERIVTAVRSLELDPRPTGAKKLTGAPGWRIRVGDYRIVYTINDGELVVIVIKIGHRREIYRS